MSSPSTAERLVDRHLVLRNLAFSGALQTSTYLLGFLTVPYLTRVLGPGQFGALAFSISLNAYGWMIVDWGFSTGATRDVAAHRHDPGYLRDLFWSVVSAKLALGLAAAATLGAFAWLNRSPAASITLAPLLINLLGGLMSADWFIQGFEKMGWYAATTVGGRAATLGLMFVMVHRPGDVWIAAVLQALSAVLGALAGLWVVRNLVHLGPPKLGWSKAARKIADNRHFFLINGNALLYTSAAPLALNGLAGAAAVGYFAAADKLLRICLAAMTPAATVMYPRTVALLQTDVAAAARSAGRSFLLQAPMGLLLGAAMYFGANALANGLFGPQMSAVAPVLQWLAPVPTISAFSRVLTSQMLYPLGHAQAAARVIYTTTPLYLVALVGLSPVLGPRGAAIAFTLTELVQTALLLVVMWRCDRTYLTEACNAIFVLAP